MIDLDAAIARLEASRAFHQREQDEMYAFAARWNAPIDETTDRRDEVAGAIRECSEALAAVREIIDAISATPPKRRPPPRVYTPREPTAAELAAARERYRIPVGDELRALASIYFDGVDAAFPRIDREVRELLTDREKLDSLATSLSNASQGLFPLESYRGQLWVERAWTRYERTGRVLALFHIARMKGGPVPRRYRPELFVATWTQTAPVRATWTLHADGRFTSDAPRASAYDRWSIRSTAGELDLREAELALEKAAPGALERPRKLSVHTVDATSLELRDGDQVYALERTDGSAGHRYTLGRAIGPGLYEATILDGGEPWPPVIVRVLTGVDSEALGKVIGFRLRSRYASGSIYIGDVEWRREPPDRALHIVEDLSASPTLADALAREPMPIARACSIARMIAEALHATAVTHGALDASAVRLVPQLDGSVRAKVVGFGLAQLSGRPMTHDVGALGLLLRAMVGDQPPPELRAILDRMLEPDPYARPPAHELVKLLRPLGEPDT